MMSKLSGHLGRVFVARSERAGADTFRGVFDIQLTGGDKPTWSKDVGTTTETYPTRDDAVAEAQMLAERWIEGQAGRV